MRKGITRHIDELGRIVIPKELRNTLNIKENDKIIITLIGNKIELEKEDNKVCPLCRTVVDMESKFCSNCGKKL